MIFEFTGLPGSGKSTICEDLESWLKEQGYEVVNWLYHTARWNKWHRIAHKLKLIFKFQFAHPILFQLARRIVKRSRQKGMKDSLSQYLNILYVGALYWRYNKDRYHNKIVLFDQGKLQALTSLIFRSEEKDIALLIPPSLREEHPNDVIIHIDVTPEEILSRLEKRTGTQSRIERMNPEDRLAALQKFEKAEESVLENEFLYKTLFRIDGKGLGKQELLKKVKQVFQDNKFL
ncbi:MAG: AAA family ATPase [Spirochaetales bacterium]|nr:AAA family ATPase [Spirochaetales bacterium]